MSAEARGLWRRLGGDRSGATALEFALVAPVMFALLLGAIQLGWALHCASSVRWALETCARSLVMNPNEDAATLKQAMTAKLSGIADPNNITVTVTPDESNPAQKVVRVTSVYQTSLAFLFVASKPVQFTATTTVPVA